MLKTLRTVFTIVSFSTTTSLLAIESFNQCAGCHGVKGEKSALGRSKVINQMTKKEIVDALNGYKNNSYGGPMRGLMKVQVKKLTKEEIADIASFISKK